MLFTKLNFVFLTCFWCICK